MRNLALLPCLFATLGATALVAPDALGDAPRWVAQDAPVGPAHGFDLNSIPKAVAGAWLIGADIDSGHVAVGLEFKNAMLKTVENGITTWEWKHQVLAPCFMHMQRFAWTDPGEFRRFAVVGDGSLVFTTGNVAVESKTHIAACVGFSSSAVLLLDKKSGECTRHATSARRVWEGKPDWEKKAAQCGVEDGSFWYGKASRRKTLSAHKGSVYLDDESAKHIGVKKKSFNSARGNAAVHLMLEEDLSAVPARHVKNVVDVDAPPSTGTCEEDSPIFMVGRDRMSWHLGFARCIGADADTGLVGAWYAGGIHLTKPAFVKEIPAKSEVLAIPGQAPVLVGASGILSHYARKTGSVGEQLSLETYSPSVGVIELRAPANVVLALSDKDAFGQRAHWRTEDGADAIGTVVAKTDAHVWVFTHKFQVEKKAASKVHIFSLERLFPGTKVLVHDDGYNDSIISGLLLPGVITKVRGSGITYKVKLDSGGRATARFWNTVPAK